MLLWIGVVVGVILVVGFGLWRLVASIVESGGAREGDAGEMVAQAAAQLQAFSGKRADDRPVWDGRERMKGFQGNDGATGG